MYDQKSWERGDGGGRERGLMQDIRSGKVGGTGDVFSDAQEGSLVHTAAGRESGRSTVHNSSYPHQAAVSNIHTLL